MHTENNADASILAKDKEISGFKPWFSEFKSSEQESGYRHSALEEERKILQGIILLAMSFIVLFIIPDYLAEGLRRELGRLLGARLGVFTLLLTALYFVNRLNSVTQLDAWATAIVVVIAGQVVFIDASQPANYFGRLGTDIIFLFGTYVAIPIRPKYKLIICTAFSCAVLLLMYGFKNPIHSMTYASYTTTIIAANVLGCWTSIQLGRAGAQATCI